MPLDDKKEIASEGVRALLAFGLMADDTMVRCMAVVAGRVIVTATNKTTSRITTTPINMARWELRRT
jgi:hypothetical protein